MVRFHRSLNDDCLVDVSERTPLMSVEDSISSGGVLTWMWGQMKEMVLALAPISGWSDKSCLGKVLAVYKVL